MSELTKNRIQEPLLVDSLRVMDCQGQKIPLPEGALLALGCFDGVHPGHRALLKNAAEFARDSGRPFGVWSPAGAKRAGQILPLYDKLQIFSSLGVDFYLEEPFEKIRDLSPRAFFEDYLLKKYKAGALACGTNFTFGKGGLGDARLLCDLCKDRGIPLLLQVLRCHEGNAPYSSRLIRDALLKGDLAKAERLLGGPYRFSSVVMPGRRVGRGLGFPTANLALPPDCPLKNGVYLAWVQVNGEEKRYRALVNVGVHPTFDKAELPLLEAHLITQERPDLYDRRVTVTFLEYVREERCFKSPEALVQQIQRDLQHAKSADAFKP